MPGLNIGYARVSTDQQDLTAQRDGLGTKAPANASTVRRDPESVRGLCSLCPFAPDHAMSYCRTHDGASQRARALGHQASGSSATASASTMGAPSRPSGSAGAMRSA